MSIDIVAKVGGSLLDLPDLDARLGNWIEAQSGKRILLVPGGGGAVERIRKAQVHFDLDDGTCHWLALAALRYTADLLRLRTRGSVLIGDIHLCETAWRRGRIPILDVLAFAIGDESRPDHLPHSWEATSDSFALRAALVGNFREVVLLKSCDVSASQDWADAARQGIVDPLLPGLVAKACPPLRVTIVNLRRQPPFDASATPP